MVYGHLFPKATEQERESLRRLGLRWKVGHWRLISWRTQQYERERKWVYEQHPFWCTGYTFWDLHSEAPDLFLHLSRSDLVFFKGDLNHRKLTYDCAAPASTPFDIAIGPMASAAGAPKVCSLRTVKSDVVVGLESDELAERLDKEEPGWKISGKYVSAFLIVPINSIYHYLSRRLSFFLRVDQGRKFGLHRNPPNFLHCMDYYNPISLTKTQSPFFISCNCHLYLGCTSILSALPSLHARVPHLMHNTIAPVPVSAFV